MNEEREERTSNIEHRTSKPERQAPGCRRYDLEDRLLEYAAMIVRLVERLYMSRAGNHVGGNLLRSGTSPLFNHGEAQSAESQKDFIHKLRICLKELRESQRGLRLILKVPLVKDPKECQSVLCETDELIRIFVASIKTAERNKSREEGGGSGAALP